MIIYAASVFYSKSYDKNRVLTTPYSSAILLYVRGSVGMADELDSGSSGR